MAAELRSIDDTLVKDMSARAENSQAPVQAHVPEVSAPSEPVRQAAEPPPEPAAKAAPLPPPNDPEPSQEEPVAPAEPLPVAAEAPKDGEGSPIDEYGNPVAKQRTYTEEEHRREVERIVRERLARVKNPELPPAQQPQKAQEGAEPQSDAEWETQLEQFVEKTLDKRQARTAEQQYRQQELQRQAEFESKFSAGMNRYGDFREVVSNKPITDTMMLATRALEDPAAFLYGASRMHPQEIERISRITDPYAVAAEVGRLHERMVKERKALSNAPRPVDPPRGDMPRKDDSRVPIDTLIAQHAKRKFAR